MDLYQKERIASVFGAKIIDGTERYDFSIVSVNTNIFILFLNYYFFKLIQTF